ncbi:MAG: M28 family peptidase [Verrucomicrobiota bacterium]
MLLLGSCNSDDPNYKPDPSDPLHAKVSGARAYAHVEAMVAMGPRPSGSQAIERNRVFLEAELNSVGWETQRQDFEAETPIGPIKFSNIRARFIGSKDPAKLWNRRAYILVGSHYDTKRYTNIRFVGANDAGSSTGLLLEMARAAASRPEFAEHLELIFFDGEEAFENFDEKDGLYGSRHYARKLVRRLDDQLRPQYVVILDMVGEKKLSITLPADTPKFLADTLREAADELGTRRYFGVWPTSITDDHIPFRDEGIAAIDIIDFDFKAWHTAKDTMDQVSAESLEIVGQTSMLFLEKLLTKPPEN